MLDVSITAISMTGCSLDLLLQGIKREKTDSAHSDCNNAISQGTQELLVVAGDDHGAGGGLQSLE
ncbi:hypothetical protein JCM31598_05380 [Desulfonatronum parangueonense]